jgi:hypothetical protein
MGNARVIAATAQQSAEDYRDAVEQVFREYRIPPGRLLRVRDSGNRMLGDVAFAVHREQLARLSLMDVAKISNIAEKCIRARIDPAQFDPPPRAA